MNLYNEDCFNIFPKIEDKSIDLFVLDLPYANKKFGNCTACAWDTPIDLEKMWKEIKRIMKPNATIIHFCNTKFGFALIESNPKWFRYDLIWKKSKKVGFLSANKMPLRQHENIYIFNNDNNEKYDDVDLVRNKELREYAKKVYKYIGKSKKALVNEIGQGIHHFFLCFGNSQFGLPTDKNYNKLIEKYGIDKMEGFKTYEEMKELEEKPPPKPQSTYNPQKTEGKPYKNGADNNPNNVYGITKEKGTITKTNRHPTSILDIEPNHENIYIFNNDNNEDVDLVRNTELREYSKKVYKYIGISKKVLLNEIGQGIDHFFRFSSSQFGLPTDKNYNELIEKYGIDKMKGFKTYDEMKELEEKELTTYNPQKTEGKPYNCKQGQQTNLYGIEDKDKVITKNKGDRHPTSIIDIEPNHENVYIFKDKQGTYNPQKTEGKAYNKYRPTQNVITIDGAYGKILKENKEKIVNDRHPTSILDIENTILEYKNPHKTIHRTQKPVDLLEWLIKTYSNENDTVMDFCMGSGTAGVACKNTNRKFIGVEKDKEIFEKAKNRINNS